MATRPQPQPNWHPISSLPIVATALDGMLEAAREQYPALEEAKNRPHVLDDDLLNRVIDVHTQQAEDLWLFEEQIRRWKAEKVTLAQQEELRRLEGQLEELRKMLNLILTLAEEFQSGTIDSIMAKSDLEIAMAFLSGKLELP